MGRWLVAVALLATGCAKSVFNCTSDASCVIGGMSGTCESDRLCSFPDQTCTPVPRHYGEYSGDVSGQCVQVNYMFVTSGTVVPSTLGSGDVDPFVTADAICNKAAAAAEPVPLPGHYVAWISTSTVDAIDRLQSARGWIRPDKLPFVDSLLDLRNGNILYPPRLDENGNDHLGDATIVATGTLDNGTHAMNANNWMDPMGMYQAGRVTGGRTAWTEGAGRNGSLAAHLYCFGIDHQLAPPIPTAEGRIAFVSTDSFKLGPGGRGSADAQCASDATMHGLPGEPHYRAFLATTTSAAADRTRFPIEGGQWIRPDKLPLEATAGDLLTNGQLATPIALGPDGNLTTQVWHLWTGAPNPLVTSATGDDSCVDWTSASSTMSPIVGTNNDIGPGFFQSSTAVMCANTSGNLRLYCLQYQ